MEDIREFVEDLYLLNGETIREVPLSWGQVERLKALGYVVPRSNHVKAWHAIKFLEGLDDGSNDSSIDNGRVED